MSELAILPLMKVDFTPHRLKAGDTIEFVTKMNAMQELIEAWGNNLGTYGQLIDALLVQARQVPEETRATLLDLVVRAEAARSAMESALGSANLPVLVESAAGKALIVKPDLSGYDYQAIPTVEDDTSPKLPELSADAAGKVVQVNDAGTALLLNKLPTPDVNIALLRQTLLDLCKGLGAVIEYHASEQSIDSQTNIWANADSDGGISLNTLYKGADLRECTWATLKQAYAVEIDYSPAEGEAFQTLWGVVIQEMGHRGVPASVVYFTQGGEEPLCMAAWFCKGGGFRILSRA